MICITSEQPNTCYTGWFLHRFLLSLSADITARNKPVKFVWFFHSGNKMQRLQWLNVSENASSVTASRWWQSKIYLARQCVKQWKEKKEIATLHKNYYSVLIFLYALSLFCYFCCLFIGVAMFLFQNVDVLKCSGIYIYIYAIPCELSCSVFLCVTFSFLFSCLNKAFIDYTNFFSVVH